MGGLQNWETGHLRDQGFGRSPHEKAGGAHDGLAFGCPAWEAIRFDAEPCRGRSCQGGCFADRAGCPLEALNAQVWKSEQPGSSPFRSGQGTDAESGPPEEVAGHFPAVAGSLHVTPLVGPSQQVFLGAERKRKKPGSWLLGSGCQTQPHERRWEGWREGAGRGKPAATFRHIPPSSFPGTDCP